jgi:hypothetical protein
MALTVKDIAKLTKIDLIWILRERDINHCGEPMNDYQKWSKQELVIEVERRNGLRP